MYHYLAHTNNDRFATGFGVQSAREHGIVKSCLDKT